MSQSEKPTTLLMVDDDASLVRLLSKLIERSCGESIRLEALTDPVAALMRIEEGGVDILLSDLEMPGIDGLELLRSAKQRNAFTQVLFITGQSTQERLIDALELGATDYLLKPIDHEQLVELIHQSQSRQQRWKHALASTWQQRKIWAEADRKKNLARFCARPV